MEKNKRILILVAALGGAVLLWSRKADPKKLSESRRRELISQLAAQRGIKPSVALAVMQVESGGIPFADDGRMIIRFEPAKFRKYTKKLTGKTSSVARNGGSQKEQYLSLARARHINDTAALMSISMGSAQIMGFNHKRVGHSTPQSMWAAFNTSEANQIRGFFSFVDTDKGLLKAALSQDFQTFARKYNGAGYPQSYPAKMRAYQKTWQSRGFA